MATVRGNKFYGSISNVVFKVIRGVQTAQSAPGKGTMKQTPATKKKATLFGRASQLGKLIRLSPLQRLIYDFYDGPMINRLNKTLREIMDRSFDKKEDTFSFNADSFAQLNGFEFNLDSPLLKNMPLAAETVLAGDKINVTLPEMQVSKDFIFPKDTISCTIHIQALFLHPESGAVLARVNEHLLEVEASKSTIERQTISFDAWEGCLCIIGIALRFSKLKFGSAVLYNSKSFNPSGICGLHFVPGEFKPEKDAFWRRGIWEI
jgi:hypothetical protein